MAHDYYNREHFPRFIAHHGNWDIYANAAGYCASIPTAEAEAGGCKATQFGDLAYVRVTLRIEDTWTEAETANAAGARAHELETARRAKAARRDCQPMPEGGLFDEVRRAQQELF